MTGAVYDRGYRPFEGERGGRTQSRFALYRASVRRALGWRRPWKQKIVPLGLLAVAGLLLALSARPWGPSAGRTADVAALGRPAVASAGPHAQREGVELVAEVEPGAVPVFIDAGRVGQAIDNLLSNASKFTPRGGPVTARVRAVDGGVEFSIADTGVGIPEDEQGMLFTRFFRASTATRNAVPGVGLGLTITRAIVLAHGGTMEVSSQEGVGTEFRFTLPAAPRTEVLMSLSRAD